MNHRPADSAIQPLVSVVIPAFNRARSVERAIMSVRDQTHKNVEIVVVDDASTDETFRVATQLSAIEPRLRVVRLAANGGAQAARNAGIASAHGAWLAFLDSDDTYLSDSIERRLRTADRVGCAAVHSECLVLRDNGSQEPLGTPPMEGNIHKAVLARPGPTFPGLLVRRECLLSIGGLDDAIVAYQEWDTAIRLSSVTRFAYVPEATFVWDQRSLDTISRDLRRSVAGYEQVVLKHVRAILKGGGPSALAAHLREAGHLHYRAGDQGRAFSRYALSLAVWPFALPRAIRWVARAIRKQSQVQL